MSWQRNIKGTGVLAALGAALLFGISTPISKSLLTTLNPWLLAGLLYLGSGIGLSIYRMIRRSTRPKLSLTEWPWLLGAIFSGGVIAPVLLMFGLTRMPASGASLLLNAEGVFTALLAWFVFRENVDKRIAFGMLAIVVGAAILSWPSSIQFSRLWPSLAVLGACLFWGIDNNLTRKVSQTDATWIAALKGLIAGAVNLVLAVMIGVSIPSFYDVTAAMVLGCLAYGISLVLFVVSLRHLGAARTGAYFSVAPFVGAIIAIPLLHESLSVKLIIAGLLMALGVWLHLTEEHCHEHSHGSLTHTHAHFPDVDHRHDH